MPLNPQIPFWNRDLYFRPVEESDLELLYGWRSDPRVAKYLHSPPPGAMDDQRAWYARMRSENTSSCHLIYQQDDRATPFGLAQLLKIDWDAGTAESGFILAPDTARGMGLANLGGLSLYSFAFVALGMERIFFLYNERNVPAGRVVVAVHSAPIEGEHAYRKGDEILLEMDRARYESMKAEVVASRPELAGAFEMDWEQGG